MSARRGVAVSFLCFLIFVVFFDINIVQLVVFCVAVQSKGAISLFTIEFENFFLPSIILRILEDNVCNSLQFCSLIGSAF